FQLGILLRNNHQAAQCLAYLALRLLELLEFFRSQVISVYCHPGSIGTSFDNCGQRAFLKLSSTFHSTHQVWNQVGPALVTTLHTCPFLVHIQAAGVHTVVTAATTEYQ